MSSGAIGDKWSVTQGTIQSPQLVDDAIFRDRSVVEFCDI